jgi:hypothetical protein
MSYVTNIDVKALDSNDWRKGLPAGDHWLVVKNKNGDAQDFNQGAGGKYIFIYYQILDSGFGVEAIRFIKGKNPVTPRGWTKVNCDLNNGAGGDYIYLYYIKSADSNHIYELQSGFGDSLESAMSDFNRDAVVLRQDLNESVEGKFIYLGYYYNN